MSNTTDLSVDELQKMKRKQLQSLCKKHGIKANGKNEELVEQLLEAASSEEGEDGNGCIKDKKEERTEADDSEPSNNEDDAKDGSNDPPEIQAPETENRIDKPQFSSVAEQVIAEMETRALSLAESQRKEAVEKYNTAHNIIAETPKNGKLAGKTAAFEKAHDKIFKDDDSILNHWSARKTPGKATPNNKRPNAEDSSLDTNKRPRVEVLFASPTVVKSKSQKLESVQAKAMTSKVQRTQTPKTVTASIDGSKTAIAGSRSQPVDLSRLSPTALFTHEKAEMKESAEKEAPVAPVAAEATAEEEIARSEKPQNLDTPATEPAPVLETNASEQCDRTEEPAIDKTNEQTSTVETQLSKQRSLVVPSSKLPAKHKPSITTATAPVSSNKPSDVEKKVVAKQNQAQRPPAKAANYRKVESKIKAYINSKATEPKANVVKQSSAKASKPEPLRNVAKQSLPSFAPVRSKDHIAKQAKDSDNEQSNVPNYMKSTRATENRAHKPEASTQQPLSKNIIPANNAKARFKPYSRPSKPAVTAKPSSTLTK
ncbi:hypothetical protein IW140_001417 [Coemansia sp. RSA 1813]|nr:hypothetical protein EV178_001063 [Coemansia sp. RSA 1646]KAJ1772196.1 hypothetical protein LPJ74_001626 [Coemansia sp. RSA 1843]KAJ2091828.1 hypothetical protein IW138_001517 [Coemansia sp. RSA 986]KAJ2215845.1 hypothetical protein EV179_001865 [Coemansia sp. RSA 487]KAJ2571776.1 hypothetical protein IW140_001417 [Coemansia sp. RSA 1813]